MATDAQDKSGEGYEPPAWVTKLDALMAIALAGFGIFCVLQVREQDPWAGAALVALAALIYFMRGQVISKFSFGKDGLVAELRQKTAQALATAEAAHREGAQAVEAAEAARKEAEAVTEVIGQGATVGGGKNVNPAPVAVAAEAETTRWADPARIIGEPAHNDPQANQWGGEQQRNHRRLDAQVTQINETWFRVTLVVQSTDPTNRPLDNPVRFHLHDSFAEDEVTVQPKGGKAVLSRIAFGAFTVGAEVADEPGTYLELDLADPKVRAPLDFRLR